MKIFYLPDLGEGLAEAEIREWYVKEGDEVIVDQPLVSMETAKAVVDVPSPYAGKIAALHGKANDIIQTGAPFITFDLGEGKVADQGSVVGKLESSEKAWDDSLVTVGAVKTKTNTIKAMPAARVLASELGVDLSQVTPTGINGLITVADVKKQLNHGAKPAAKGFEGGQALHGVRRIMAQAMAISHKEIVPVSIIEDADISHLPPKTDMTVLMLKAIAHAVKTEPALNAWFDGASMERKLFSEVNIGMATDTEEGLFVPVIKDVANQSPASLRATIDKYKVSVRDRSIAQADMQGATITLSNFGTIAGQYATPIIVPPAVAILGCGRSRDTAIVRDGQVLAGRLLPLSLTFDHRAVTGGEATRFLGAIIDYIKQYQ